MIKSIQGVTISFDDDGKDPVSNTLKSGRLFSTDNVMSALRVLAGFKDAFVMDIGAHVGTFTYQLASFRPKWRIHAIEGSEKNFAHLEKGRKLNNFENVTLANHLVGNGSEVGFVDSNSGARVTADGHLKTIRLDDMFVSLDRLDFVKMDIEGNEIPCLQGMEKIIKKHMPVILIEFNGHTLKLLDYTPNDLVKVLESFGYIVYTNTIERRRIKSDEMFPFGVIDCLAVPLESELSRLVTEFSEGEQMAIMQKTHELGNQHIKDYIDWYSKKFNS